MTIKEINEIMESARIFARDYHGAKPFAGFSEDEVMKGVAAFNLALIEVIEARDNGRQIPEPDEMYKLMEDAAGIKKHEWGRVFEVYEKLAKIMEAARMLEHQDGRCAVSA